MRRTAMLLVALTVAGACAKPAGVTPGGGPSSPDVGVDARRLGIYEAAIRSQIEFDGEHVWIYDRICTDAEGPGGAKGDCPDAFEVAEQRALLEALSDIPRVEFVHDTESLTRQIFDGKTSGQIVRVGPIDERDGRIEVAASHYCGGLCGGGSVWVIEQGDLGWRVTGPAPGHGQWIS